MDISNNLLCNEIQDAETRRLLSSDPDYEAKEGLKPLSERWMPPTWWKLASEHLYGKERGKVAFIVGNGPSREAATKYLSEKPDGIIVIALNAAIRTVPADYWFFLDGMSYLVSKSYENALKTRIVGCHRFWRHYGDSHPNFYLWLRAHTQEDIKAGRIVNHATSLIGAMHIAAWLGCVRIITVGCENRIADHTNQTVFKIGDTEITKDEYFKIQRFTYQRIAESLIHCTKYWKPSWCSLLDASGDQGELPLPKTTINYELNTVLPKIKERYGDLWLPSPSLEPTPSFCSTTKTQDS